MDEIINKDSEEIKRFTSTINTILDSMDNVLEDYQPFLNGRRFMTDNELSKKLHISRRSLQDYRNEGKVAYYQFGGKILYLESDIVKFLENNRYSEW